MKKDEIIELSSMPLSSPSYPVGPYRFIDREYFIISYKSDFDSIKEQVPEPLEPEGDIVLFEFIKMPDSSGFGDYTESGVVIPCLYEGRKVNFTSQMYLDCLPPIAAGREIWGFPKKLGYPSLKVKGDTLVGSLYYADDEVALGTMKYKVNNLLDSKGKNHNPKQDILDKLQKPQVNLKVIPCVSGSLAICQLVEYQLSEITVKEAWSGDARLNLTHHVNAPLADLPIRKMLGGLHIRADLSLPYGKILYDYLKDKN